MRAPESVEEQLRLREANVDYPERIIPGEAGAEDLAEHVSRYAFAAGYASGKTVLDLACGVGYGTDILARAGAARVVGLDISEDALAFARDHYQGEGVEFVCASATRIPLADASIDLVVAFEMLEHLKQPEAALAEVARVLREDGRAVLSVPNGAVVAPGWTVSPNRFHEKEYTFDEFRGLLARHFEHIEIIGQAWGPRLAEYHLRSDEVREGARSLVPEGLLSKVPAGLRSRVLGVIKRVRGVEKPDGVTPEDFVIGADVIGAARVFVATASPRAAP